MIWNIWQHLPGKIGPVLYDFGFIQIRYYGLMYVAAFLVCHSMVLKRVKSEKIPYSESLIQNFFLLAVLSAIIGGRLGYVVFYDWAYFSANPSEIFSPVSFTHGFRFVGISGMSYHGGLVGVLLASVWFARRYRINFWDASDLISSVVPMGYFFGRMGNFVNHELYGRITDKPWGMYFPSDPSGHLRHPSQLYEAFFEGLFLFAVLWVIRRKPLFQHRMLAVYLMGYGMVRFFVEFFREPDLQLGFVTGSFTMGQILCALMMAVGLALFVMSRRTFAPK